MTSLMNYYAWLPYPRLLTYTKNKNKVDHVNHDWFVYGPNKVEIICHD